MADPLTLIRITTMAAPHSVDPVSMLEQHLACASPDLLREMIASLANAMMCAQADQACGAGYGERSGERVNRRNGYRAREWDSRAGTVELAIPKLREGSYYPGWLLTHRRRGRAGPGHRDRHRLPAGCLDPAGGAPS
jgi:hypothetical protein